MGADFDMCVDGATLLGESGHIKYASLQPIDVRCHGKQGPDCHDTSTADACH